MLDRNKVAGAVTKVRVEAGLNKSQFSRLIGVTDSAVCQYEKSVRMPSFEALYSMWKSGVDINQLMTYVEE